MAHIKQITIGTTDYDIHADRATNDKDGVALNTFFQNICGEKDQDLYKGSTRETLSSARNLKNCEVRLILNTKDYCLAFVNSK